MDDYIPRQVILKHLEKCKGQPPEMCYSFAVISEIERFVKSQPAADVAPVVHAKWIPTQYPFMAECEDCSECGYRTVYGHGFKFCPNCGAKMSTESEEKQ